MGGWEASLQRSGLGLSRTEHKLLLQWGWDREPALAWVCREKGGSRNQAAGTVFVVQGGQQQTLEQ